MRTRSKGILIRLTDDEFERVQKLIDKSNLSQQEFCKRAVLGKEIVVVEGFQEFSNELKRIGNNLNQLTKEVHQNDLRGLFSDFDNLRKELIGVWQSLRAFLERVRPR